jgi:hypothetical protein
MKSHYSFFLLVILSVAGCSQRSDTAPSSAAASSTSKEKPAAPVDPASAGTITGTVSFRGAPPKLPTLDMSADPMCPQKAQPAETVVVSNGKLANVFVYVKQGLPQGSYPVPSQPVVLDQKECRYFPRMMGVMAKQPLKVLNDDQAIHNIHDMPSNNPQWNETQMPTDQPITKSFTRPEMMVPLQCNQHPWMRAYVNVMPHPYFAVSGADGSFEIRNLPPGDYTLAAVHEKFGERTLNVRVEPQQTAKAPFEYGAVQ